MMTAQAGGESNNKILLSFKDCGLHFSNSETVLLRREVVVTS